jgi:hypothetical protein
MDGGVSMTLEEALREAAAKGLTHLTLYPVQSEDRKTTYWCARATPSTGHAYVQREALDPVQAVQGVLDQLPKAPKRVAKEVTATVTEPKPSHLHDGGLPPPSLSLEQWK